eukprot:m.102723 g.102723  ORF g.102723 m.102723 type:complete len:110 (-) comp16829_c0_seq2:1407-1736(-)
MIKYRGMCNVPNTIGSRKKEATLHRGDTRNYIEQHVYLVSTLVKKRYTISNRENTPLTNAHCVCVCVGATHPQQRRQRVVTNTPTASNGPATQRVQNPGSSPLPTEGVC